VTPGRQVRRVAGSVRCKFACRCRCREAEEVGLGNCVRPGCAAPWPLMQPGRLDDANNVRAALQRSWLRSGGFWRTAARRSPESSHPDEPNGLGAIEGRSARLPMVSVSLRFPTTKHSGSIAILANSVFVFPCLIIKLVGTWNFLRSTCGTPCRRIDAGLAHVCADSRRSYVADTALRMVSAIDAKTLKEVARIKVGEVPKRMNTLALPEVQASTTPQCTHARVQRPRGNMRRFIFFRSHRRGLHHLVVKTLHFRKASRALLP